MLSKDILQALQGYAANMQRPVTFVLQTGAHSKRDELAQFLAEIASVSDKITLEERDLPGLRSPLSFALLAGGEDTGIRFSGIPSGHEFNSLVLAMLQASGTPIKLDDSLQQMVGRISEALHFEVFVSLSCHNCPEVVQALNQFALLNPNIRTEMIDGGLFQDV
ncbi:MAG TPA: alkyl hydroperoxide reductase subunit F, partial [Gammaproteobacteria bacterium]|nr:alkyl hydroperoxide reductase subunit F [Gammaproteobacteria bacterium]